MTVRSEDEAIPRSVRSPVSPRWFAGLGTLAGIGGLAASSCCALPVALAGIGVTGAAFGGLHVLTDLRPVLLGGAALMLLVGWGLLAWHRDKSCAAIGSCAKAPAPWRTAVLLGSGTMLVGLALVWEPYVEPLVLRAMRG